VGRPFEPFPSSALDGSVIDSFDVVAQNEARFPSAMLGVLAAGRAYIPFRKQRPSLVGEITRRNQPCGAGLIGDQW
jgi:hypothetical protein